MCEVFGGYFEAQVLELLLPPRIKQLPVEHPVIEMLHWELVLRLLERRTLAMRTILIVAILLILSAVFAKPLG